MDDPEFRLRSWRSSERRIFAGNEPMLPAGRDCGCRLMDEIVAKHEKIARLALAGQAEAEEREMMIKRELDLALEAKADADKRLSIVEAELANCIEQLNSIEGEMEGRIRDAVVKGTTMFVERQVEFEEKLNEATADFVNLSVENSRLAEEILGKDKVIEELDRRRCVAESELDVVATRLDEIEKENAFLRYEFQLMEKEVAVCNEELECCRQSAEEMHKKHLQGLKKVAKLEAECQRLRVLSQKRVTQSAAMTRMSQSRRSHVTERLQAPEDENETLKEVILNKDSEVNKVCNGGSSDDQHAVPRYESGFGKDCTDSESWADALILELENFRKPSPETDLLSAKELVVVPLEDAPSSEDISSGPKSSFDWLQVVLNAIAEQHQISKRDSGDLLLDVGIALGFKDLCKDPQQTRKHDDTSMKDNETDNHNVTGLLPSKALPTTEMGNDDEIKTMETAKIELEERLEDARQEIYRMNDDVVRLNESKRMLEDQIEHQKSIYQDLETELIITRSEINEIMQKYYSLEIDLEDQNRHCEELELICIEMELQLGGVAAEPLGYDGRMIRGPTLSREDREERLEGHKDAIVDAKKQLKTALSPTDESSRASSDRRSTSVASRAAYYRPSLHDRMLADGFAELKPVAVPHHTKVPSPRRDGALLTSGAAIRGPEMRPANAVRTTAGPQPVATSPVKRNGGRGGGGGGFGFVKKLLVKNNVGKTMDVVAT
ncbi:hypothetical protein MLD38_034792 [Melastoma candidum]|uniref:Uncharacterized protein n=1 Tax=Melastoma candidum TaxID=119954 RepID=A0ACB9MD97_9MYRT|nr:hypothetical protein MLD38_034792 [Melastoma candidum]